MNTHVRQQFPPRSVVIPTEQGVTSSQAGKKSVFCFFSFSFFLKKSGIWRTYLRLFQHRRLHRSELLKTPSAPCRDSSSSSSRRERSVSRCRQRFLLARSLVPNVETLPDWALHPDGEAPPKFGVRQLPSLMKGGGGGYVLIIRPWIFQNKKVWWEAERQINVSKQR